MSSKKSNSINFLKTFLIIAIFVENIKNNWSEFLLSGNYVSLWYYKWKILWKYKELDQEHWRSKLILSFGSLFTLEHDNFFFFFFVSLSSLTQWWSVLNIIFHYSFPKIWPNDQFIFFFFSIHFSLFEKFLAALPAAISNNVWSWLLLFLLIFNF